MEKIEMNQGGVSINPAGYMITVEEYAEGTTTASNGEYAMVVDDSTHEIVRVVVAHNGYWCKFR